VAVRWPQGFGSSGVACGIKPSGVSDLGVLAASEPIAWAGVFTTSAAAAAPVRWCRAALGSPTRAVVANSGNANACTGESGVRAVRDTAAAAAEALGCSTGEVLVASTGPIGRRLPVDKITAAIGAATTSLTDDVLPFARSILTTDTVTKSAGVEIDGARLVGAAKGAAMIAPNMATMLAFVATDAALPQPVLQRSLGESATGTFNRISIDACESTNDSVILLSSGLGPAVDPDRFGVALDDVCRSLADQIVRDAEGGTRLMRLRVSGASEEGAAEDLAFAIAASDLWRSALHGADPNWGRVVAALGSADRTLDLGSTSISIGGTTLFDRGEPVGDLAPATAAMSAPEVVVEVVVGTGAGRAEILASDLSPDYVKLNSEGTT
jgi:glutamate N-acetyltransferase / amino-acid N-acetyltransferase